MTAFIITSIALFLLSLGSNMVYLSNGESPNRMGAVIGVTVFSIMITWAAFLLLG
jgi:steroid 5-alpha reductase family enzyme